MYIGSNKNENEHIKAIFEQVNTRNGATIDQSSTNAVRPFESLNS